ncbi:hypothetical protein [Moraxella oblonga]|uniref:hypothetical protein n=1 Tax=Moraxella oblonga TaxID=200413 RepID=UPI001C3FC7BE|nr:hypothetical protein [Moraxella oblonga]
MRIFLYHKIWHNTHISKDMAMDKPHGRMLMIDGTVRKASSTQSPQQNPNYVGVLLFWVD